MHRHHRTDRMRLVLGGFITFILVVVAVVASTQLQFVQDLLSRASNEPARLAIDPTVLLGPLPRPWRNLAQGGESHDWRLAPIANQVRELNPEYIRIDHIYDFYHIVSGSPGNLSFNFSGLDPILDDILAAGAKPYIALSYMPPAIATGDIVSAPMNYSDWQLTVQKTIEHVSGTRRISGVYYEVWNEPDLFGGWSYYGHKNYLTLYEYSARGAMNARNVQPFKIGGPATTALYKNWVEALIKFASARGLRLDFISWHRYDYNIDRYRSDMRDIRNWMRAYPEYEGTLEYHLTEWGHDSDIHAGYDTVLSAAHTVAGAIEMIGIIERAFVFEIQDGKDPQGNAAWGRWGMFQHQDFGSQPKPRFYALKMLDSLQGERIQLLGKGSFVKAVATKDSTGAIGVVVVNYDPSWRNTEAVPITISPVEPGSYTITQTHLNGQQNRTVVPTEGTTLNTSVLLSANGVAKIMVVKN